MKVEKKIISDSVIELLIEVEAADVEKMLEPAAKALSKDMNLPGFRAGTAPYSLLKEKLGEGIIWEQAAKIFISKKVDGIIADNCPRQSLGMPQIEITKLAPGNALEFKVTVSMLPEVTLPDYKSLEIKIVEEAVTEEDINKVITELKESRVREQLSDQPLKIGDKAIVDIKMYLDKVPLEGGQATDTALILGKDYMVPGFDDKIIGAAKGEVREFFLVYPADHFQKNIAGKKVEFNVIVKEVYERLMPEVNEEMAAGFGFKTPEELLEAIKVNLTKGKAQRAKEKAQLTVITELTEKTKFSDIPEILIESELENMLGELEHNLSHYGGNLPDYLLSIKKTEADLMVDWREDAIKRVKSALMMREIAKVEKIEVGDPAIDHEIEHLKEHYRQDGQALDVLDSPEYRRRVASDLANRQVIRKLTEWNIK